MSLDETIRQVESYLRHHEPIATAAPLSFYDGSLWIVRANKPDVPLLSDPDRELYCSYIPQLISTRLKHDELIKADVTTAMRLRDREVLLANPFRSG